MTLALHGKSRQRQWLLAVIGVLAVFGATMLAVAAITTARADGAGSFNQSGALPIEHDDNEFTSECTEDGDRGPYLNDPGTVWHFVATHSGFVSLQGTFSPGGVINGIITNAGPNIGQHGWILAPNGSDLTAVSAVVGTAGDMFVLSHVCEGEGEEPEDPTIEKTYNGPSDGNSFSWTIEITNPNDEAIEAYLLDEEAFLDDTNPAGQCTGETEEFTCNVAANSTLEVFLYTPLPVDFDVCDPQYENFAQLMVAFDVDRTPENVITEASAEVDDTPPPSCDPIELDPSVEKTYDGFDGTNFSWTVEITNPDDEPLDVSVNDPGASLVPNAACDDLTNPYDCTVPADDTLILEFYTSEAATLRLECRNTVTVSIVGTDLVLEAYADVDAEDSPCDIVPIQICKVFLDNEDGTLTGDTQFFFEQDGNPLDSLTVPEDGSDCFVVWISLDTEYTFSEDGGSIVDDDGFPMVGLGGDMGDAAEGNSITLELSSDEGFFCDQPNDQLERSLQAIEIEPVVIVACTITFWNKEEPGEVLEEGIITVIKYLDINGDGDANDPGEGPIEGWSIIIDGAQSFTDANGETGDNVTVGDTIPVSEETPAGYNVVGARVNFGGLQPGASALNVNITGAVTVVEFFNQPLGDINVHKNTYTRHNGGASIPRPNDDDGWTITVTSVNCDINVSKQTDANGNASFEDLPLCTDYVVSENPVNPSSPGYAPQGSTSVNNVTPGGATITFNNAILTFDPVCTNLAQCGPVTLVEPTPTPTNTPVVPPTETPVPPTATPEEDIEGERTPGPATPIAPSTGSGTGGSLAAGMNMLLVIAGLLALGSGLTVAAAARRKS